MPTEHQQAQQRERDTTGNLWEDHGFASTSETGRPIDPRADNREWAELLEEAHIREARLHDARRTAATVLLVLWISQRAVMGDLGWSNTSIATRYQHLTPDLRRDIANQVDEPMYWLLSAVDNLHVVEDADTLGVKRA